MKDPYTKNGIMDLSAIDEVVRETSSVRHTEQGTMNEKLAQHLKRMNRFIVKMHQKANL